MVCIGSCISVNLYILIAVILLAGIEGNGHTQLGADSSEVGFRRGGIIITYIHAMISLSVTAIGDGDGV